MIGLFLTALAVFASQVTTSPSQSDDEERHRLQHAKHDRIERAIEKLDVNNRASAEELYDATMDVTHYPLHIPDSIKAQLKGPMVDAELAYWNKQTPGIHEQDIVKAYNNIVTKLNLPDEAKTTLSQLREIHDGLLVNFNPKFMGRGLHERNAATGEVKLNRRMSPLQTIHTVMSLIDTKLVDIYGVWLVTPDQWEKTKMRLHTPGSGKTKMAAGNGRPQNSLAVEAKFHQAMYAMTDLEGLTLLKDTLSTLGVI